MSTNTGKRTKRVYNNRQEHTKKHNENGGKMAEQKRELLTERVMIRLTKKQADKLNKEANDRTLEEGGTISISMIIRKALRQARPDIFEEDGK